MNFHNRAVQRNGLDLDTYDLRLLQPLKQAIQNAALAPAIHPRVNRVPVTETFRQTSPLAALFGHIQDRVQDNQILESNIAALPWKTILDLFVLSLSNFHTPFCAIKFLLKYERSVNLC
jgi:hypothetical protein